MFDSNMAVAKWRTLPRSCILVHWGAIMVDYPHSWFCRWFCIQQSSWRDDSMVMIQPICPRYQHRILDNEHYDFHGCSTGVSLMRKDQLVEWWIIVDGMSVNKVCNCRLETAQSTHSIVLGRKDPTAKTQWILSVCSCFHCCSTL